MIICTHNYIYTDKYKINQMCQHTQHNATYIHRAPDNGSIFVITYFFQSTDAFFFKLGCINTLDKIRVTDFSHRYCRNNANFLLASRINSYSWQSRIMHWDLNLWLKINEHKCSSWQEDVSWIRTMLIPQRS